MRVNALEEEFERVIVLDKPMLFTCLRVDRDTVPSCLHVYDVRHDDGECGDPIQIARWVLVNHYGTLISTEELPLVENALGNNAYLDIDPETDFGYEDGHPVTLMTWLNDIQAKQNTL